ncbi:MAG: DUF1549 domain-containing protein [Planctomycetaceae bacterium]
MFSPHEQNLSIRKLAVIIAVVSGVAGVVAWAARSPLRDGPDLHLGLTAPRHEYADTITRVNQFFESRWKDQGISPAPPADEWTVLRRLSLALHGTIPSLEELRKFEADAAPDRVSRWTASMLADVRFADYFSVRLGRCFIGVEEGQLVIFRRDRFTRWLSEQLRGNVPFDRIVRDMIIQDGAGTDKPAVNFVTAVFANDAIDVNKLTGRTVRAFLGQRIDCAQCHDHPFDKWKQAHFEGLAAFYGQTRISIVRVTDDAALEYKVQDRKTLDEKQVAPQVPFHPEWLPADGTRREQLATWVTHPENRRFERAIVNRIWGLMFGKPWHDPVDGVPDPSEEGELDLLDILGKDFREHGYDLKRLIHVIADSRAFLMSSEYDSSATTSITADQFDAVEAEWGVFPLVRLRPEQIIGSMLQAGNVKTIDQNSHLFTRITRLFRERDFVREYGDLGDSELDERAGTIPQALLRMNGQVSIDATVANPFSSVGRIVAMASTDERCIEICYLVCLTRKPTPVELTHFLDQLRETTGDRRTKVIEDLVWTLFNSPEFSWNH